MKRNRTAHFHVGDDYACVMLEGQTTNNPLVRLYGPLDEIKHYGELIERAINEDAKRLRVVK